MFAGNINKYIVLTFDIIIFSVRTSILLYESFASICKDLKYKFTFKNFHDNRVVLALKYLHIVCSIPKNSTIYYIRSLIFYCVYYRNTF